MIISKESIKYSWGNIIGRKTRSFLTILSIFIGITTIFIFVSFGIGLYDYINQFATGGTADKITIMTKGIGIPGMDDTFALSEADLRVIEKTSGVYEASGIYIETAEIKQKSNLIYTFAIGYEPEKPIIFDVVNVGLDEGRWLRSRESGKVLLGYNYKIEDRIFPKPYATNDKIEIHGEDYRIVGFVEEVGNPQDDSQIYMDNKEILRLYGEDVKGYGWIIARVDVSDIERVIADVEDNLRDSRDLEEGEEDFFVQSWQDLMDTYSNVLNGIVGFVILIALISVVVSAVNTSNTMITSVLERFREIGIMKAVGARNSEVFKIFLFESAVLGFIAGCFGVFLGWGLTFAADKLLYYFGWGLLSPHYSWYLFAGLILFATITGAISGAVPAYRASKINPVEALRYE
jgi:putative ABC transport system permease protein